MPTNEYGHTMRRRRQQQPYHFTHRRARRNFGQAPVESVSSTAALPETWRILVGCVNVYSWCGIVVDNSIVSCSSQRKVRKVRPLAVSDEQDDAVVWKNKDAPLMNVTNAVALFPTYISYCTFRIVYMNASPFAGRHLLELATHE